MSDPAREWVPGIRAPLPPGERVRWGGAPAGRALARRVFHVRKIAAYFALLIAWRALASVDEPAAVEYFLAGAAPLGVLGAVCLGCSLLLARLTERATVYAITDRRVVLRIGLVLQATINIPFRQITAASVKLHEDGTGDIALRLGDQDRLAFLMLWPHARAWHLSHPQPTLRCVPDAARIGELLRAGVLAVTEAAEATAPSSNPPANRSSTASSPEPLAREADLPAEAVA
jgi:hypothetical protein